MSCSSCSAPPSASPSQKPVRAGLRVDDNGDEVIIIDNGSGSGNGGGGLLIALVITFVIIIIAICVGIACNGSSQCQVAVPVAQSVASSVPSYGALPTAPMPPPTMQGGGSAISSMSSLSTIA